jgi:tetratricopeptide (TPR) repeat protein
VEAHHQERLSAWLDLRDVGRVRAYVESVLLEEPENGEFLELAADCAHGANDYEAELRFRMRGFTLHPNFTALRKVADVLSRTNRWEMAAEAWLHIARARPLDAQAFAEAASALSRLQRYDLAATSWECACRIQPDNPVYADAHAAAIRSSDSERPQGLGTKGRKNL